MACGNKIEFLCKKLSTYFQLHKGTLDHTLYTMKPKSICIYIPGYIYIHISDTHILDTRSKIGFHAKFKIAFKRHVGSFDKHLKAQLRKWGHTIFLYSKRGRSHRLSGLFPFMLGWCLSCSQFILVRSACFLWHQERSSRLGPSAGLLMLGQRPNHVLCCHAASSSTKLPIMHEANEARFSMSFYICHPRRLIVDVVRYQGASKSGTPKKASHQDRQHFKLMYGIGRCSEKLSHDIFRHHIAEERLASSTWVYDDAPYWTLAELRTAGTICKHYPCVSQSGADTHRRRWEYTISQSQQAVAHRVVKGFGARLSSTELSQIFNCCIGYSAKGIAFEKDHSPPKALCLLWIHATSSKDLVNFLPQLIFAVVSMTNEHFLLFCKLSNRPGGRAS